MNVTFKLVTKNRSKFTLLSKSIRMKIARYPGEDTCVDVNLLGLQDWFEHVVFGTEISECQLQTGNSTTINHTLASFGISWGSN